MALRPLTACAALSAGDSTVLQSYGPTVLPNVRGSAEGAILAARYLPLLATRLCVFGDQSVATNVAVVYCISCATKAVKHGQYQNPM